MLGSALFFCFAFYRIKNCLNIGFAELFSHEHCARVALLQAFLVTALTGLVKSTALLEFAKQYTCGASSAFPHKYSFVLSLVKKKS